MAEELKVHTNTVSAHTRRLEAAGLLTVTRSGPERDGVTGEWCRRETNRYWLRFPCKEKAVNRRVARRRRRLGVETVVDPASVTAAAEELLASDVAVGVMAEIDGPEPDRTTGAVLVSLPDCSAVTYTQPDGSEALTGTQDTGTHVVGEPGVVEKVVSEPVQSPLGVFDAKVAFAAMRATLDSKHR